LLAVLKSEHNAQRSTYASAGGFCEGHHPGDPNPQRGRVRKNYALRNAREAYSLEDAFTVMKAVTQ